MWPLWPVLCMAEVGKFVGGLQRQCPTVVYLGVHLNWYENQNQKKTFSQIYYIELGD